MMYTAVATDGMENTQYTNSLDLALLIEKCREAAEVYDVDCWIENDARSIVWHPDADKITQEAFDLVMGG